MWKKIKARAWSRIKKIFHIRTYFPKGIMGRMMLLIILPLVMSQFLSGYIFYKRHWRNISNQSAMIFAGNVLAVMDLRAHDRTEKDFSETTALAKKNFMMDVKFLPGEQVSKKRNSKRLESLSLKYVTRFLNQNVQRPYSLSASEDTNLLEIRIQYPKGVLLITSPLKSVFSKTIYIFFYWVLGSIIIFLAISIPFAKHQVDAIKNLTSAISKAGRGEELGEFRPGGPMQISEAGQAFMKTYNRISRYLKSRTDMLSGISHDLKTPLTRMKLELEFSEDKDLQFALLSDIEEMEKMIDSYLSYAKGNVKENSSKTDITAMMKDVIRRSNKGNYDVAFDSSVQYFARVRPLAFERALANVMSNAMRYSNKKIAVGITERDGSLLISVEDNGRGIPEDKREEMLKPFTRMEGSRNPSSGGVGLGLAIVQEIIHQHGGEIKLGQSKKLGGLLVTIEIPLK
jgi:two-component system osmolarity sensor histidine kinase EnvZ